MSGSGAHRRLGVRSNWRPGPEGLIQKAILEWARLRLRGIIVHHADSGSPSLSRRRYLKWLGSLPGWPDLFFVGKPDHIYREQAKVLGLGEIPAWAMRVIRRAFDRPMVMAMEVKSKTGTLTPAQKIMRELLVALGVPYFVVRSVQDAEDAARETGFLESS